MEAAILKQLLCLDPDTCNIVRWNDFFCDKNHNSLNFKLPDQRLYTSMDDRKKQGLYLYRQTSDLTVLWLQTTSSGRSGLVHPVSAVQPGVCVQTTWSRAPLTHHLSLRFSIYLDLFLSLCCGNS